jgi:lipid-binding SYLF domain-containing protein
MGSKGFIIFGGVVLALSCYAVALSQSRTGTTTQFDEAARAENAATVLSEIMEARDQGIPETLLKKAYAIAVIPHVVQGTFGIGRYGKGVVALKNADGDWGTPLFIEVGGGSVGLQLGVEPADVVLVFKNSDGIKPLLKGKLRIGADVPATAGPVGRKTEAGTATLFKAAIYSYLRSRSGFAGIALDGTVIQLDDRANTTVNAKNPAGVALSQASANGTAAAVVEPFLRALRKYAPAELPKLSRTDRR